MISGNVRKWDMIDDSSCLFASARRHLPIASGHGEDDQGDLGRIVLHQSGRCLELRRGPLTAVFGDRALMRQSFATFFPMPSQFTRTRKAAVIEIGAAATGMKSAITVKDNGTGFDMRFYDQALRRLSKTSQRGEFRGPGVGLAIVQRIIHRQAAGSGRKAKVMKAPVLFCTPDTVEDLRWFTALYGAAVARFPLFVMTPANGQTDVFPSRSIVWGTEFIAAVESMPHFHRFTSSRRPLETIYFFSFLLTPAYPARARAEATWCRVRGRWRRHFGIRSRSPVSRCTNPSSARDPSRAN